MPRAKSHKQLPRKGEKLPRKGEKLPAKGSDSLHARRHTPPSPVGTTKGAKENEVV